MQVELLNRHGWKTRIELATAIHDYIEPFLLGPQLDGWFEDRANPRMHKTLRRRPVDRLLEERAVPARRRRRSIASSSTAATFAEVEGDRISPLSAGPSAPPGVDQRRVGEAVTCLRETVAVALRDHVSSGATSVPHPSDLGHDDAASSANRLHGAQSKAASRGEGRGSGPKPPTLPAPRVDRSG